MKRVDEITPDECLRDYTFIWTRNINAYLSANPDVCDRYIIFASFLMDFMLLNFFWMWLNYWKSYKMIVAYVLFFGFRGFVQVRLYIQMFFKPLLLGREISVHCHRHD